ncbi:unnamed protein product [Ectocarpus sp. 12 AP-2014]
MLYISLVNIFGKSVEAFHHHGYSDADAYLYATLSLFGGMLCYRGIEFVVHLLGGGAFGDHNLEFNRYDLNNSSSHTVTASGDSSRNSTIKREGPRDVEQPQPQEMTGEANAAPGDEEKLVQMGLLTAVAIGIHNFPDGLATFVSSLADPSVGLALAVAIAIHNIPEGMCVAIPVYYGTGSRCKAFGWALLSGASEPIGAALGWLILKDVMSELAYGILFGLVAGIMVNVVIHDLIPTAVRFDPADKVTTNSISAGMAIMALSLVLFVRSGGH